jgi:hypothetical protein
MKIVISLLAVSIRAFILLMKMGGGSMKEENYQYKQSEDKLYTLRAIDRLAIGAIVILWGSLLILREVGIIDEGVSTWPLVFVAFGLLLVLGGIYRLYVREKTAYA